MTLWNPPYDIDDDDDDDDGDDGDNDVDDGGDNDDIGDHGDSDDNFADKSMRCNFYQSNFSSTTHFFK